MNRTKEIMKLSTAIINTTDPQERRRLSTEMSALAAEPANETVKVGFLQFTESEIAKMPELFRQEIAQYDNTVQCIKRYNDNNTVHYEIRYCRNGYEIVAAANDINAAKEEFIRLSNPARNTRIEINKQKGGEK